MTELMMAYNQWRTRPSDERFWTLEEMRDNARESKERSEAYDIDPLFELAHVGEHAGSLSLDTTCGKSFDLNNWTFGQLCSMVQAPSGYLSTLNDSGLVAECLTDGLRTLDANERSSGLSLYHDDTGLLRSITSQRYSRIHDVDILDRLLPLQEHGWKVPPARPVKPDAPGARPATAEDLTKSTWLKEGDMIGPAGLYRGDRDMFAFLVNDDARIDDGSDGGLSRGFIVGNSEVGKSSFLYTEFKFRGTCGNHIVWGASDVKEIKLRHVGADLDERAFTQLQCRLTEYANASTEDDRLMIAKSKSFIMGQDKDEVLDFLFGKRLMTRNLAGKAWEACVRFESDLDPTSAWGIANGLSRISQRETWADKRMEIDTVAGKLLQKVAVDA